MSGNRILLDTGVLVRFLVADDPESSLLAGAIARLIATDRIPCFTSQIARECWSVLTRPKDVNGFGLPPAQAGLLIGATHREFEFLADGPGAHWRWLELVERERVAGRQVHDAFIVASMLEHGITDILSLDERDFCVIERSR